MLVLVIVDDVVLVLADDIHRTQHVESIIDAPLYVFEVNFLSSLSNKLFG